MNAADQFRLLCVLGPIVALLTLGGFLTVRSGLAGLGNGHGVRLLVVNLSKTIAVVSCCLLGLAVIQLLLGVPHPMLR